MNYARLQAVFSLLGIRVDPEDVQAVVSDARRSLAQAGTTPAQREAAEQIVRAAEAPQGERT